MLLSISSSVFSVLNAMAAETPCIIVFVGITITFLSESSAACCAASIMFELFGSTNTFLAFACFMALSIVSMLGFIVWPPSITTETPRSLNTALIPSPALTDITAYSFSFRFRFSFICLFCSRMFSILILSTSPSLKAICITLPGTFE